MLLGIFLNTVANLKNSFFRLLSLNNHTFKLLKSLNLANKFFNNFSNVQMAGIFKFIIFW